MVKKILRITGIVLGVGFFLFGVIWLVNYNSGLLEVLNGVTFVITGVYFTFYGITGRSYIFSRRAE